MLGDYTKTTWLAGDVITAAKLNNNENKTEELDLWSETHSADYTLQVPYGGTTTNVGNAYSIATPTISALTAGMAIAVKINADSSGASTLNWDAKGAKSIKKVNGTDITNLKANGIYTLRYDGTNFILQGEGASGNATASDLLLGKTATVDAGEIVGTLLPIKSIQSGKQYIGDGVYSANFSINTIVPENSIIIVTGPTISQHAAYGEIIDANTIMLSSSYNYVSVYWYVIEFDANIVKSKQSGSKSHNNLYTESITINTVSPEKCLAIIHASQNQTNAGGRVTTNTNLEVYNSNLYGITKWQLIEFK